MSMNVSGNAGQIAGRFDWFQNRKVDQTPQKAKDALPLAGDTPVKVTLSKEGRECYRQKFQNSGVVSVDEMAEQKELLSRLSMSAEDEMETQFHDRLAEKNGTMGRETFDKNRMMENCRSVYMSLYDEIRQGYAQGTREKWIADGDILAGGSYRRLTEKEELAALDKVFNFYSSVMEGYANYGMKAGQDVRKAMENFQLQLK